MFSPLSESPGEQSTSESTYPSTKDQQVQTEVIFNPYDCFYCGNRLETTDQLKTHTEVCHGRPWDIFCCEQCTLNFSDVGDLKKHVEKVHDPAKLLHCLQELFKPKVKNYKCTVCGMKFEFDSELELHVRLQMEPGRGCLQVQLSD